MSFAISPLQNAAQLAELHQQAFDPSVGAPWNEAAFAKLLRQSTVQALGTADGFILWQRVADEAEILTLAVHPKARRSGLARALIQHAVRQQTQNAENVARLFLEVAQDNAPARALYAACGFRETGVRPNYYKREDGNRVDGVLMQLETR